MVTIELVYVPLGLEAIHMTLALSPGATVADALNHSGIYRTYPETREMVVGIYAKLVSLDVILKEGDRIEIYRPLALDPKEKRRQLARKKR